MTLIWDSHPYLFYSQWHRCPVSTHFNTCSPIHLTLGKIYQSLTFPASHHHSPDCVVAFHPRQGPICSASFSCCVFLVSFLHILTGQQLAACSCRCVCVLPEKAFYRDPKTSPWNQQKVLVMAISDWLMLILWLITTWGEHEDLD